MRESIKRIPSQLLITSLGNTIEWFDFGLFIYLAPLIGEKFFPSEGALNTTLAAFGVFAIGFICRPLGGIIFGYAGDTTGRAKTLRISIILISISTLLIGFLPSYENIGISAPIIFILLRMFQGISIGGEYSGIIIYLAESSSKEERGFFTSFAAISANLGFLSATLVLMLLRLVFDAEEVHSWAWRLPFILLGLIGTLLLYYRFNLAETPIFSELREKQLLEKQPLLKALRYSWRSLLKIFGLTCMSATLYYIFFGFIPNQISLQTATFDKHKIALLLQSASLLLMIFLVPMTAKLGDHFGRKRLLIFTTLASIVLAIPAFLLLYSSLLGSVALAFFIATCLSSFDQGNTLGAIVENCLPNVRYSGIAFSYNLGNAIFGGTAPFIALMLSDRFGYLAPAYYLMALSGFSLLAASTLLGKGKEARALSDTA